jgi:hypothetical protein
MDYLPWQEAELSMLDERVFAVWNRALGQHVVEHRDRHWIRLVPGFFQPIHPLARLSWDEATRPAALCWGFRACLDEANAWRRNAGMPVHLLPDPLGYDLTRLAPKRRREIRRALRAADVVVLRSADLLLDQGYRVSAEQHARTPGVRLHEPTVFRRRVLSYFEPPRGIVLAALRHGRLMGFTFNAAVDGTLYCQQQFVSQGGFGLSLALFHVLAMVARRCSGVREVMNGLLAREDPGLSAFKRRQGLEVVMLPTRAWFAPGFEAGLRWLQPHRTYRLTGRG